MLPIIINPMSCDDNKGPVCSWSPCVICETYLGWQITESLDKGASVHFILACDAGANGMSATEEEDGLKWIDKSSNPSVVDNAEGLLYEWLDLRLINSLT
jgi:hypothetical protein